jgi:glycosyltransferase involved in cell wall biosynthesis
MKLLICTQTVDVNDPVLGFFHSWIENLSKHFEKVHVICLKEGKHTLPGNVFVHSLGKENLFGPTIVKRLLYIGRINLLAWRLRREYNSVFVHMNQEYVFVAGAIWRILGKHIVMWRNHPSGSYITKIAGMLTHAVCYTSKQAYVAKFEQSVKMPIGIDVNQFSFTDTNTKDKKILFFGRMGVIKRPELFIKSLLELKKRNVSFHSTICGDADDKVYWSRLKKLARPLVDGNFLTILPGITHDQAPTLFRGHGIYVNLTPSGSFDKTIGEAMSSGCIPVILNKALENVINPALFVNKDSIKDVADSMQYAVEMLQVDREKIRNEMRKYVKKNHSINLLVVRLVDILQS